MDIISHSKISFIIPILLVLLIMNRRINVCRILMNSASLFLLPFILYTIPGVALDTLLLAIGPNENSVLFKTLFTFLLISSTTFIIAGILIKLNLKPFSKNLAVSDKSMEYIKLEQGRSLLQYSIWYTLYITIIHLPICLLAIVVSSFSPMVIMYVPYIIFALFLMYGLAVIMSLNGAIRVKGITIFKVLILMFIPFVNFIMMIKINYEAKKTLKELSANFD